MQGQSSGTAAEERGHLLDKDDKNDISDKVHDRWHMLTAYDATMIKSNGVIASCLPGVETDWSDR
jgi:hypothetical protein